MVGVDSHNPIACGGLFGRAIVYIFKEKIGQLCIFIFYFEFAMFLAKRSLFGIYSLRLGAQIEYSLESSWVLLFWTVSEGNVFSSLSLSFCIHGRRSLFGLFFQ